MKKSFRKFFGLFFLVVVLTAWFFSLYKIYQHVSSQNFSVFGIGNPPLPPKPPCPPCGTPTPTPTEPEPTPTVSQPSPTPTLPPTGGGDGGGVGGPPSSGGGEAPHCGAQVPSSPFLRSLRVLGGGEIELVWDPVEPVTFYSLSYGPSSGNYLYGVPDTGKVNSFKVGGLGSGDYCFIVRAVNDCAPSSLSNERCTGAVLGVAKVLGVTTLGPTGSFQDSLFLVLFMIGSVCLSLHLGWCQAVVKRKP